MADPEMKWGGLYHHEDRSHEVRAWDAAACAALRDTGGICPAPKCGKRIVSADAAVSLTPETAAAVLGG